MRNFTALSSLQIPYTKRNGVYGCHLEAKKFLFYLHREKSDTGLLTIVLDLDIAILSKRAVPIVSQVRKAQSFIKNFSWRFSGLCRLDELFGSRRNSFLPSDTLTVRCRMRKKDREIPEAVFCFARTRIGIEKRIFSCL